jgi:hypothetical protein
LEEPPQFSDEAYALFLSREVLPTLPGQIELEREAWIDGGRLFLHIVRREQRFGDEDLVDEDWYEIDEPPSGASATSPFTRPTNDDARVEQTEPLDLTEILRAALLPKWEEMGRRTQGRVPPGREMHLLGIEEPLPEDPTRVLTVAYMPVHLGDVALLKSHDAEGNDVYEYVGRLSRVH